MKKAGIAVIVFLVMIVMHSCGRKTNPTTNASTKEVKPAVPKAKPVKRVVPKVIAVNDKVAKRHIDGRYYYDLDGHRYWRNNRDGKYYLFHKSMFDNPDFKSMGN